MKNFLNDYGLVIFWLAVLVLLNSCVSYQKIDPSKTYKRDLIIKHNGKAYEGVAVIPVNTSDIYSFEVESRTDLDLFVLSSCSKFLTKEKSWNGVKNKSHFGGLWKRELVDKTSITFDYNRSSLERSLKFCPIIGEAQTNKDGRVAWFMILFADPYFNNKYHLTCSDQYQVVNGTGICQNLAGNFIEIITEEKSRLSAMTPDCSVGIQKGKVFRFQVKPNICSYNINALDTPKFGVLSVIGIDDILIRE
jgi:hypothetical protein